MNATLSGLFSGNRGAISTPTNVEKRYSIDIFIIHAPELHLLGGMKEIIYTGEILNDSGKRVFVCD